MRVTLQYFFYFGRCRPFQMTEPLVTAVFFKLLGCLLRQCLAA
jgi:hypothetical protein